MVPVTALAIGAGCGDASVPEAGGAPSSPPGPCDVDGQGADGVVDVVHTVSSADSVQNLSVQGDAVYWVDKGKEHILRLGLGDAAPEVVVTAPTVQEMVVDGDFVYWRQVDVADSMSTILRRAPISDGAAVQDLTAPHFGEGLALDTEWLYFAEGDVEASAIRRIPKEGGAPETVLDGEHRVFEVAIDVGVLSWVAAVADPPDPYMGDTGPTGVIRRLNPGSTAAETLLEGSPSGLQPSAAGDGVLYYRDYVSGWSLDVYGRSGIGGYQVGEPVWVPVTGPSLFSAPASDAACLYWVAPRPPLGEEAGVYDLQRAAHGGGEVETIATVTIGDISLRYPNVALSGDAVYWSLGSAYPEEKYIYRTSK